MERAYEWFSDESGQVYGEKRDCYQYRSHKLQSDWKPVVYRCDYCLCTCVADRYTSRAVRFIDMQEQAADINMYIFIILLNESGYSID